jgi:hypothetical protein
MKFLGQAGMIISIALSVALKPVNVIFNVDTFLDNFDNDSLIVQIWLAVHHPIADQITDFHRSLPDIEQGKTSFQRVGRTSLLGSLAQGSQKASQAPKGQRFQ